MIQNGTVIKSLGYELYNPEIEGLVESGILLSPTVYATVRGAEITHADVTAVSLFGSIVTLDTEALNWRQRQVVALRLIGYDKNQIANFLKIAVNTVQVHSTNSYKTIFPPDKQLLPPGQHTLMRTLIGMGLAEMVEPIETYPLQNSDERVRGYYEDFSYGIPLATIGEPFDITASAVSMTMSREACHLRVATSKLVVSSVVLAELSQ